MESTTTRVPAVVDALVARLRADLDCQVVDGPPAGQDIQKAVLFVGYDAIGSQSITTSVERAQGLGHRYTETFQIACLIDVGSGDEVAKTVRDRAHVLFAGVDAALKTDRALGGVCDLVSLGPDVEWHQVQTEEGAACGVSFSVVGQAAL